MKFSEKKIFFPTQMAGLVHSTVQVVTLSRWTDGLSYTSYGKLNRKIVRSWKNKGCIYADILI